MCDESAKDELLQGSEGGGKSVSRTAKSGAEGIAHRLENMAAPAFDSFAKERIVTRQGNLHFVGVLFPALRAALYIGEKEDHRAGR